MLSTAAVTHQHMPEGIPAIYVAVLMKALMKLKNVKAQAMQERKKQKMRRDGFEPPISTSHFVSHL